MSTHSRFKGTHVLAPKWKLPVGYLEKAKESELRIAKKFEGVTK